MEDIYELWEVLEGDLRFALEYASVKLVIVDSVAALCRPEFTNDVGSLVDRSEILLGMAAYMKRLAHHFGVVFVVVNQVTSVFHAQHPADPDSLASSFLQSGQEPALQLRLKHTPALGLTWSSCVTTRLFLDRQGGGADDSSTSSGQVLRSATLLLSPSARCGQECQFRVRDDGVSAVP